MRSRIASESRIYVLESLRMIKSCVWWAQSEHGFYRINTYHVFISLSAGHFWKPVVVMRKIGGRVIKRVDHHTVKKRCVDQLSTARSMRAEYEFALDALMTVLQMYSEQPRVMICYIKNDTHIHATNRLRSVVLRVHFGSVVKKKVHELIST